MPATRFVVVVCSPLRSFRCGLLLWTGLCIACSGSAAPSSSDGTEPKSTEIAPRPSNSGELLGSTATEDVPIEAWTIVQSGIEVQASILRTQAAGSSPGPLREGESVTVRFSMSDTTTREPLGGVFPAGWLHRHPGPRDDGPGRCHDQVESFVGGSLLDKPELDLNVYHVITLNEDATLSVVDPLFGFGGSKLLHLVDLASPGFDWALDDDHERLFVSQPQARRVAVVDTHLWNVVSQLDVDGPPGRVHLQPDAGRLWVAIDGSKEIVAFDPRTLARLGRVEVGEGPHAFASAPNSRTLYVTAAAAGTVTVVDTGSVRAVHTVPTSGRPVAVAFSSKAQGAYVSLEDRGEVLMLDGTSSEEIARIEVEPGIGMIDFEPDGRLGFVVDRPHDAVHIIDTARNQLVQTARVEEEPDQVTFSRKLAYVRHAGSSTVLMIPVDTVGRLGQPVHVVDFTGGDNPPGRTEHPTPAAGIVQAPGADAVLVANPEDQSIYMYTEGMAAPMGEFSNYGHQPRAVLVVDRSLKERAPGRYETHTVLRRAGEYDLAMFIDSPRIVHCFPLRIETVIAPVTAPEGA